MLSKGGMKSHIWDGSQKCASDQSYAFTGSDRTKAEQVRNEPEPCKTDFGRTFAARRALRRYTNDPRPRVRNLAWLIRHQIRAASTSNSPALRDTLAGNVALLAEIAV